MSLSKTLSQRSGDKCELCGAENDLAAQEVSGSDQIGDASTVAACIKCRDEINGDTLDMNHWRCLNDCMWSQVPAVQVVAYRMLHRLAGEGWAQDLLEMMYLEEDTKKWADAGLIEVEKTLDVNGTELKKGDNVTVIKDLPVKGSSQVIKQGTMVRGISLADDPTLISGKANGQSMYLIAAYCRKK
ncbi:alkylphosphonate utilization protein [Corallincola holothuriorum]|uniref:Alkylphosphonate utilization protein n=1 Tax=Corallincola holothuriorum TaxID=2282215 RepID=A0A368NLH8_9GAMM|nr:PhnA domain-containing protein [Corallincola holothuriorum]RCU51452.1 alkylphosphonate utilization protein [Corallincola holothuriorum]